MFTKKVRRIIKLVSIGAVLFLSGYTVAETKNRWVDRKEKEEEEKKKKEVEEAAKKVEEPIIDDLNDAGPVFESEPEPEHSEEKPKKKKKSAE